MVENIAFIIGILLVLIILGILDYCLEYRFQKKEKTNDNQN
jgi:uncharacterized membrane protein (DUF373 family)